MTKKELYELACKFQALSPMARAMLGTHFLAIGFREYFIDEEKGNEIIFKNISLSGKLQQFKRLVELRSSNGTE